MVAAGAYHTVAPSADGALWSWGRGYEGQLGHGDTERRRSPAKLGMEVFGGSPVVMAACGFGHTLVLTAVGEVFSCGSGGYGQLGHGDVSRQPLFRRVAALCAATMIAAGEAHSLAVSSEGEVWAWGNGRSGQLGTGEPEDMATPVLVGGVRGATVMVAAGNAHTLAVTAHGSLWSWGCNLNGQLGLGDTANRWVPFLVGGAEDFAGSGVVSVACGDAHSLAVTEHGCLYAFGKGAGGQLGLGDLVGNDQLCPVAVPAPLFGRGKVVAVAAGEAHSVAVTNLGGLFTWGTGKHPLGPLPSGLGHGSLNNVLIPTEIAADAMEGAAVGRCRQHHLDSQRALAFAMGGHPRLGRGSAASALLPELLQQIVAACSWQAWPEGRAGEFEGVVRLLGGGGMLREGEERV